MEQELRRKTAILKGIVHNAPDGVIIFDHGGNRIFQNQRLNDIFKIPEKIATNQDLQEHWDFCLSRTKKASEFALRVAWFQNHPDESGSDAIELIDGTILRGSTAPLYDDDRTYYGRVWIFRDLRDSVSEA